MAVVEFPPVELADESGLLALGGDLEVSSLLLAYSQGIFPWPISKSYPLAWFSPDPRGVLFQEDLHVGHSLAKFLRKNPYRVTFNQDFGNVILNCAYSPHRRGPAGERTFQTWITEEIIHAYLELHLKGHAYSVEVWREKELVGGIYGVAIDRFVSGESMFYKAPNASKVALIHLMATLKEKGIDWLDTQMVTPVVAQLGGREIPRSRYLELLGERIQHGLDLESDTSALKIFSV